MGQIFQNMGHLGSRYIYIHTPNHLSSSVESISLFSQNGSFDTVDGRNPANHLIGGSSHYLQGFIHVRWCRISSVNNIITVVLGFLLNTVILDFMDT